MRSYVTSSGQIQRNVTASAHISIYRLIAALSIAALFYTTNPANNSFRGFWNETFLRLFPSSKNNRSSRRASRAKVQSPPRKNPRERTFLGSLNFLGIEMDFFQSPEASSFSNGGAKIDAGKWQDQETNYGLFSLGKKSGGVWIGALLDNHQICSFDGFYGEESVEGVVCAWIAKNFCHSMVPFNHRSRPLTVNRILSTLLIVSRVLSSCIVYTAGRSFSFFKIPCWTPVASIDNFKHRPLFVPMSVFFRPAILSDLIALNFLAYRALEKIDKLVSFPNPNHDASLHFYLSAAFLFLIIGGCSNLAASFVTSSEEFGFDGAVAAALGYQTAVSSGVVMEVFGLKWFSGDMLLTLLVLGTLRGRKGLGFVAAWIFGGIAGSAFGRYQNEHYMHGLSEWFLW